MSCQIPVKCVAVRPVPPEERRKNDSKRKLEKRTNLLDSINSAPRRKVRADMPSEKKEVSKRDVLLTRLLRIRYEEIYPT